MGLLNTMLAYIPIIEAWPTDFPKLAHFLMFFPLVLGIAIVYRATRVREAREIPRGAFITFVNIVLGMAAIGVGFYAIFVLNIRYFS